MIGMDNLIDRLANQTFDPRVSRRNLSYFLAAAKLGNFTKAASLCGVAQPSLSRGILLLEDALETKLFDRVGRTVKLTPKGNEILPSVELFLNQCIDFTQNLGTGNEATSTELKVAAVSSLTSNLLPSLLHKFETQESRITVTMFDGINPDIVKAVEVGDVDLGIITSVENPAAFRSEELFRDQFGLVVGKDHPFTKRDSIKWEELEDQKLATFAEGSDTYSSIADTFRRIGTYFEPTASVRFRNTLMGLVVHRGLVAVLPRLAVEENKETRIRTIPLVDPTVLRTYYLVERRDGPRKPDIETFSAFLRRECLALDYGNQ
jgi:DNA-binding transcriptional LysR family regulator